MGVRLADALLRPISPVVIVLLGLCTIGWGAWIGSPFWDVFERAGAYSKMADLAPEWLYGIVAVYSGLTMCKGAVTNHYSDVVFGSLVGVVHWWVIGLLYLMGDWQSPSGITSLFIGLLAGLVHLNGTATHHQGSRGRDRSCAWTL